MSYQAMPSVPFNCTVSSEWVSDSPNPLDSTDCTISLYLSCLILHKLASPYFASQCICLVLSLPGKDNTGVTDRVVNQLLTLIDGADASMGGVVQDSDDEGEGGNDGGSSNQVRSTHRGQQHVSQRRNIHHAMSKILHFCPLSIWFSYFSLDTKSLHSSTQ